MKVLFAANGAGWLGAGGDAPTKFGGAAGRVGSRMLVDAKHSVRGK
jgi:hypothetical protein